MIFNKKMCIENIKLVKILTLSIFLIKYGTSTSLSKDPQISRENMIKHRNIVGSKPSFYKLDDFEAVDVDNPIDFEFAEFLYSKYRT